LPESQFGTALAPYLPALERRDTALNQDANLKSLLRQAGDDPAMHQCQDGFFDRVYWQPAASFAQALGAVTPLGGTVVYDSVVHGSWSSIRDRTTAQFGKLADIGEKIWIEHYIDVRRAWLASFANSPLRFTVYRMDSLRALAQGSWDLPLPLTVRGLAITQDILTSPQPIRASAQMTEQRFLQLRLPYMQGSDVKAVQDALIRTGAGITADGVFGPATEAAVKAYQTAHQMVSDGIVGPATSAMLGAS
jgi:chitosanase